MKRGIDLISEERQRQITKEGWDAEHDSEHTEGELAVVAAVYAVAQIPDIHVVRVKAGSKTVPPTIEDAWPDSWDWGWDKRDDHRRMKSLIIAGALIAAEIDRLSALEEVVK